MEKHKAESHASPNELAARLRRVQGILREQGLSEHEVSRRVAAASKQWHPGHYLASVARHTRPTR